MFGRIVQQITMVHVIEDIYYLQLLFIILSIYEVLCEDHKEKKQTDCLKNNAVKNIISWSSVEFEKWRKQ